MDVNSASDVKVKMSWLKYQWALLRHKWFGKHYWIDNSRRLNCPPWYNLGLKCLICDKKKHAISGYGWVDDDERGCDV